MITQEDIDAFRDMTEDGAQEGYVYVITNKAWPEWVKIGRAIDANDRLRSYQTNSPLRDYWIVYSEYFDDVDEAHVLDKVAEIGPRLTGIFEKAAASGKPTNEIADAMARSIIAAAR